MSAQFDVLGCVIGGTLNGGVALALDNQRQAIVCHISTSRARDIAARLIAAADGEDAIAAAAKLDETVGLTGGEAQSP